jgi:hypothetical protein
MRHRFSQTVMNQFSVTNRLDYAIN